MPLVAALGRAPTNAVGELLAEPESPLPDGLVADDDGARCQHLLDYTQAERGAEVEPRGLGRSRRPESVNWQRATWQLAHSFRRLTGPSPACQASLSLTV